MEKKILTCLFLLIIGIECLGSVGKVGYRFLQKVGLVEDTVDDRFLIKGADIRKETTTVYNSGQTAYESALERIYSKLDSRVTSVVDYIDTTLDTQLALKYQYIELFGLTQKLINRTYILDADESQNIIRLADGKLTNAIPKQRDELLYEKLQTYKEIRNYCEDNNKQFLVVLAPYKIAPNDDRLIKGVTDYSNSNADRLIELLLEGEIDYLDLREEAINDGLSWSDMFYDTDHHWTTDTAFWAYTKIADYMSQKYHTQFKQESLDKSNYDSEEYKDVWLGSRGRRVGEAYAGIDDFNLLIPKFEVSQKTFVDSLIPWTFEGGYIDTIIDYPTLEKVKSGKYNKYTTDIYSTVAYGNCIDNITENLLENNGEEIYIGRDSFGEAASPYFTSSFKRTVISGVAENVDLLKTKIEKTDYVIYIYNIGNV